MSQKVKIYFVLPTLYAGGAERVISFISQNLNKNLFISKLIVIGFEMDSKFEIDNIPVIYLNKPRILNALIPITRILIKERPDLVMSSIGHLNVLMGLISIGFLKIKFIGRLASISKISSKYNTYKPKSMFHKMDIIKKFAIRNLDFIICQSEDMKNDFLQFNTYDESKIKIIHNPITLIKKINKKENMPNDSKKYITVGRLTEVKGHLRILQLLSKLKSPFTYTVVGDGHLRDIIFEKANLLGIYDNLNHISYSKNVNDLIAEHDMFLQGSYSEGFPNALLESCAVGTPVLAFNAPGGTKEIVENGINGFLVDDENEFLEKLNDNRIWDPEAIRESVVKKFSSEKILKQYENLFLDILK